MAGTKPKFGSALDGYCGSDNSVHVNFIGADDHVHELYIAPGRNWVDNDLTALAGGAAPGNTALVGYWGSDNSEHVNYFAAGADYNHLQDLYIHPGASGWVDNDLTSLADGFVPIAGRALAGYCGSDNSQHVNYIGSDDHVHELYIHPGASGWVDNDLTALSGGVDPLVGYPTTELVGYWGSDNSQHVNFINWTGTEAHVHELYIRPGQSWVDNDLTALAGAAKPRTGPPPSALAGYWGSDGSVHVNFFSVDGHVHELYIRPGQSWVDNDLTALAGAMPAAEASALVGYWGSDSSVHVNFIGTDGHVHELYIRPGQSWVDNDLTKLAAAELPALDTALAGYWGSDSSVHVNFIGTDGDVHELYIAPGHSWVDNDLTALA